MSDRVREILSWYGSDNPGTKANLYRMLTAGRLAGTGKLVILPVDQGFEHGPARSFAPNPAGYDPRYHFQLALDAGCNAYAAPLGFIEAGAAEYAGQIPLILKLNNSDSLVRGLGPLPGRHGQRPGRAAPGLRRHRLHDLSRLVRAQHDVRGAARAHPRGQGRRPRGRRLVLSARLGPQQGRRDRDRRVRLRRPDRRAARRPHHQGQAADRRTSSRTPPRKVYEKAGIPIGTLAERVKHVVQSAFDGRRIVIFSGGEAKGTDEVLEENRQIAKGGGFGTIMGRNSFQRPHDEAVKLLNDVMDIHASHVARLTDACGEREERPLTRAAIAAPPRKTRPHS